jgi:signal transduction histidine kinase
MKAAAKAIHSIRNNLTPILGFAEMALAGDRQAQRFVIRELARQSNSINEALDIIHRMIRKKPAAPK